MCLWALSFFPLSAHLSSHILHNTLLSFILSSLQGISDQILSPGKSHFSPLEKSSHFPSRQVAYYNKITLKNYSRFSPPKNSLHFSPKQVTHYNKIILKNLCVFHLGRSPIIIRLLWKIFISFITLKIFHFSLMQVVHYNRPFLDLEIHYHHSFFFFTKLTI
jgi:hypothetical protein